MQNEARDKKKVASAFVFLMVYLEYSEQATKPGCKCHIPLHTIVSAKLVTTPYNISSVWRIIIRT